MAKITFRKLSALKAGQWVSDGGVRGAGMLAARKLSGGGVLFYFRYTTTDGARESLALGQWDSSGGHDLSLERVRDVASAMSMRYRAGDRDLREVLESDARERTRLRDVENNAANDVSATQLATLGALLMAYTKQLKRDGKESSQSVEAALKRHVEKPWPKLWRTPADALGLTDLLPVVAKLIDEGKLREAGKLRSYIRAAYAAAIRARQDPRGLSALRALRITQNPARDLATVDGSIQSRDRTLSVAELRAYWRHIKKMPNPPGALLRFHLLTGGQRVRQLARLTMDDYDVDTQSVRLLDKKGRRRVPRNHDVPLLSEAIQSMNEMGHELGPNLFTLTRGATSARYETMRDHFVAIRDQMSKAGEIEKGPFTVGDLRRTVETRLAAIGLQPGDLGQLQSHGLGGVQSRHYNEHDYLSEKRAALEKLYGLLGD
jgi:hypothetical protein